MKLLLIQISDFHIKEKSIPLNSLFNNIQESLKYYTFDKLLILICGDITFSGEVEDFKYFNCELNEFISNIKAIYNSQFNEKNLYIVPGNHDICYGDKSKLFSEENISLLDNYLDAFKDKQTIDKNGIGFYDNDNISVLLLNSCYGSRLVHETGISDYGKHYLTTKMANNINSLSPNNVNIIVMHHGLDWFEEKSRQILTDYLKLKSTCLLVGHEHKMETQTINSKIKEKLIAIMTPATSDINTINNLGFNIITIDLDNENMSIDTMTPKYGKYDKIRLNDYNNININCNVKEKLNDSFENYIKYDSNGILLNKYFVFEGLKVVDYSVNAEVDDKIINCLEDAYEIFNDFSKITIRGSRKSGKTTLAKIMYNYYYSCGNNPLLIDLSLYSKKVPQNVFLDECKKEYDKDVFDCCKVVILDNIDILKEKHLIQFLNNKYILDKKIIMFSSNEIDYDIKKILSNHFSKDVILNLNIERFTYNKRKQLIEKYFKLKNINPDNNELQIKNINDGLSNNIMHYAITPSFVIKCVTEYVNNNHIITFNNYDKIYESDIMERLNHTLNDKEETKIYAKLISEIAYYLHSIKKRSCSENDIKEVVYKYCEKYHINKYDIISFITDLKDAKIIRYYEESEYGFTDNADFAYFIANKIKSISNFEEYNTIVNEALDNVFSYINSDIVLFLILLKADANLVKLLVSKIEKFYSDTNEFSFDNLESFFSEQNYSSIDVNTEKPSKKDFDKDDDLKDQKEKRIIDERTEISVIDPYKYSDVDKNKPENQIIISLKYLEILSKTLSSFYLDIDDIEVSKSIINILYHATNKTLYKIFKPIESDYNNFLIQFYEFNKDKITQHAINESFKKYITLMMLVYTYFIYSMIAQLSINKSTINLITEKQWQDTDNNLLQVSLFYLQNNDLDNFAKCIRKLKSNRILDKSNILKVIIKQFYFQNKRLANSGTEASLYDEFFKNNTVNTKNELIKNKFINS